MYKCLICGETTHIYFNKSLGTVLMNYYLINSIIHKLHHIWNIPEWFLCLLSRILLFVHLDLFSYFPLLFFAFVFSFVVSSFLSFSAYDCVFTTYIHVCLNLYMYLYIYTGIYMHACVYAHRWK